MQRLTKRSIKMAMAYGQDGLDAITTIAARAPGLMTAGDDPTGAKRRESQRMVQEKVGAAWSGAFGAQSALANFMIKAAFGQIRSAADVSHALADITDAATAPARRTVRANARRLSAKH